MTVKELKEQLSDLPDDMEVILQKDGEGNGFSPLAQIDFESIYVSLNAWQGDVYPLEWEWSADDADMSEEEWKKLKARPRALILSPVN